MEREAMSDIWIACTLAGSQAKSRAIWLNMSNAATFHEAKGGSRVWFGSGKNDDDESCVDVVEAPVEISRRIREAGAVIA